MLDDVKVEIPIDPSEEFRQKLPTPFEINGIIFSPEFHRNGDVISYSGQVRNLYVKMVSEKLILMNSWHKFFNGNNYSDFNWKELQDCMDSLGEVFGEKFWTSRITKLTAGVNLNCDSKIIVDRLISFKGIPMEPMRPRNSRLV